nr:hypothetical protein CFP56_74012 [Quercus suber]
MHGGVWKPLKASRENIGISHQFFANDLIFFAKVDEDSCETISEVLDELFEESSQKVSMKKSRVYFSPNMQVEIRSETCARLGIQATANIGNCLGFSINHKGVLRNRLNFIAERVISKLSGWKARFLFFARRSMLVKSVMSSIPNYVMQATALPAHLWFIHCALSSDKSSLYLKVFAESNTALMQRKNPQLREGTSLSPINEGTLIHPRKAIPTSIPKSLKPGKGLPGVFSMAGSSNSLPQDSSQHVCHQPAHPMVKKARHTIPTQPHGNQPQTLSSETASHRPSPMIKPSIQLYST